MSYDFRLCLPQAGRTEEEIATADIDPAGETGFTPRNEARKRRVAESLFAEISTLESASLGPRGSGGETKTRLLPIELNSTADNRGIQITLFDNEASVSLSYGPQEESGMRRSLDEIWRCLATMREAGGYFVFDPQLGRVLDLAVDLEAVAVCYGQANGLVSTPRKSGSEKIPSRAAWLPPELERVPYFWRWCVLSGMALLGFYVILPFTLHTRLEALVLVPGATWFGCKMLLLDVPRLKSIGWSPRLTFISIFLPAGIFLQLLLFFIAPKRASAELALNVRT